MSEPRRTYEVHARQDDEAWGIVVPEVPGALSLVRRLSTAERSAREAIAWVLGVPQDSFDLRLVVEMPGDIGKELAEVRDIAAEADRMAREAADRKRLLIGQLKTAGLSGSDIAAVLDVSPQRVSQLTSS